MIKQGNKGYSWFRHKLKGDFFTMIDAIVYSSLSGSCEEYAHRMSAALHVPFFTEQSHICPTGRKVVYIGWLLAGKVVGLDKAKER